MIIVIVYIENINYKEKEMKEGKNQEKNMTTIICILGMIFLLFASIFILIFVSNTIERQKVYKNANLVEVQATIIGYREETIYTNNNSIPIGTSFNTYYKYTSSDGTVYSSFWQTRIKTEEEAKEQIGKKVKIYVDDELKVHTKSLSNDKTGVTIGATMGALCLLLSLGLFIYLVIKFVQWKKNKPQTKKLSKEEKKKEPPKNFCVLHRAIILLSVFMIIGCVGSSISKEKEYQVYANAHFEEVEGVIYKYKEFEMDSLPYYATYYKYVDKNNNEYMNLWQNDIYDKKKAEDEVGKVVTLYYDSKLGVLKSLSDWKVPSKPNHTLNIIVFVIFLILFLNSLVRFIRFIVRDKRYEAEQRRQREEGQYER